MNGRDHTRIFYRWFFTPLLVLLLILRMYIFIPMFLISNMVNDPDEDQKWLNGRTHRSFYTHSILLTLSIMLSFGITLNADILWYLKSFVVCGYPVMVHLLLDIPCKGERKGKYCINFFPLAFRLNGRLTVLWFIANILIVVFAGIQLVHMVI